MPHPALSTEAEAIRAALTQATGGLVLIVPMADRIRLRVELPEEVPPEMWERIYAVVRGRLDWGLATGDGGAVAIHVDVDVLNG